jgi:hypothetical protein
MPAAGDIGLCGKVCMGLYGEIFTKKKAVTKRSEHFLTGKSKYVVDHDGCILARDVGEILLSRNKYN